MADAVEVEYHRAIARAISQGDNDLAYEVSIGLSQYRELYKTSGDDADS